MNPAIISSSVTSARELSRIRREENEKATQAAHDAALHVLDVIDAIAGPLPLTGPRTGTHPMATRRPLPPPPPREVIEDRPPMATRIPSTPPLHAVAETTAPYITAMALASAFVAGLALGRVI
jgi:hypothetical protein